jgi:SSS family solute:Na+ symporter
VKSARKGLAATFVMLFLIFGMIIGIGLFSRVLLSGEETAGPVLSAIIATKAGKLLGGILFVAVVAAIMSTMDTALNTGAMSLTHDVCFQLFPQRSSSHVILASRIATVSVAALAFLVATRFQSILKTLGLASEIMAVGFFIPGISMIFLKRKWPAAGLLSLILGGGFAIVGFFREIGLLASLWICGRLNRIFSRNAHRQKNQDIPLVPIRTRFCRGIANPDAGEHPLGCSLCFFPCICI